MLRTVAKASVNRCPKKAASPPHPKGRANTTTISKEPIWVRGVWVVQRDMPSSVRTAIALRPVLPKSFPLHCLGWEPIRPGETDLYGGTFHFPLAYRQKPWQYPPKTSSFSGCEPSPALTNQRELEPPPYMFTEMQFTATLDPAHLIKHLMQNIEPSSTVADVCRWHIFWWGFVAATGRLKTTPLVGNDPPVAALGNGIANGNDFLAIKLVAVLDGIDQSFLKAKAHLRSPTIGHSG